MGGRGWEKEREGWGKVKGGGRLFAHENKWVSAMLGYTADTKSSALQSSTQIIYISAPFFFFFERDEP